MAKNESIPWNPLLGVADHPLDLTIPASANIGDVCDTLSAKLSQLSALLNATYGNSRESFSSMNDTHQDNYLWACSNLADECRALFDELSCQTEIHPRQSATQ